MPPQVTRPPYLRGCGCGWCNAQRTEYEGSDGAAAVEGMTGLGAKAPVGLPRSETRESITSSPQISTAGESSALIEDARWLRRRLR